MTIFEYARVSTDGQSLASQNAQLHKAGCAKVYAEKLSGVRTDRPELAKVLRRLQGGDVLMVTRLDRFESGKKSDRSRCSWRRLEILSALRSSISSPPQGFTTTIVSAASVGPPVKPCTIRIASGLYPRC